MTVNDQLFIDVLAQIESDPDRWDQGAYAKQTDCGTAYCFAGWAVTLSGFTVDFSEARRCHTFGDEPLQTNFLTTGVTIEDEAEVLLGVNFEATEDDLFAACNTLDDLYRISAAHMGLDEAGSSRQDARPTGDVVMPESAPSTERPNRRRDTSWPLESFASGVDEDCTCGHPRSCHAFPGPASTPCTECRCPTYGVMR